jgi:divalent metal cation (Fe/Co/Zn/Cd) transporter
MAQYFIACRDWIAAIIRSRAGRRLDSLALVADGADARADAYVSLAVVASASAVAAGLQLADRSSGSASRWSSCASPLTPGAPCAAGDRAN